MPKPYEERNRLGSYIVTGCRNHKKREAGLAQNLLLGTKTERVEKQAWLRHCDLLARPLEGRSRLCSDIVVAAKVTRKGNLGLAQTF